MYAPLLGDGSHWYVFEMGSIIKPCRPPVWPASSPLERRDSLGRASTVMDCRKGLAITVRQQNRAAPAEESTICRGKISCLLISYQDNRGNQRAHQKGEPLSSTLKWPSRQRIGPEKAARGRRGDHRHVLALCSSGLLFNIGQPPKIRTTRVWMNDVPAYAGLAAVTPILAPPNCPRTIPRTKSIRASSNAAHTSSKIS